jgi:hypothetical protein
VFFTTVLLEYAQPVPSVQDDALPVNQGFVSFSVQNVKLGSKRVFVCVSVVITQAPPPACTHRNSCALTVLAMNDPVCPLPFLKLKDELSIIIVAHLDKLLSQTAIVSAHIAQYLLSESDK